MSGSLGISPFKTLVKLSSCLYGMKIVAYNTNKLNIAISKLEWTSNLTIIHNAKLKLIILKGSLGLEGAHHA
jgi:hypothetical protein